MVNFTYLPATQAKEATAEVLGTKGAAFIAGGTTLLDLMKLNVENHGQLVDINAIAFKGIEQTADGLRIGALERMSDVGEHPLVMQQYPMISEALLLAAWFHDSGYLDTYDGHEYKSMERAEAWLGARGGH